MIEQLGEKTYYISVILDAENHLFFSLFFFFSLIQEQFIYHFYKWILLHIPKFLLV